MLEIVDHENQRLGDREGRGGQFIGASQSALGLRRIVESGPVVRGGTIQSSEERLPPFAGARLFDV